MNTIISFSNNLSQDIFVHNSVDNREISLYIQRRVRVDVGHVFSVKTNPYLKIKYTFEIFHQPAVKL